MRDGWRSVTERDVEEWRDAGALPSRRRNGGDYTGGGTKGSKRVAIDGAPQTWAEILGGLVGADMSPAQARKFVWKCRRLAAIPRDEFEKFVSRRGRGCNPYAPVEKSKPVRVRKDLLALAKEWIDDSDSHIIETVLILYLREQYEIEEEQRERGVPLRA